MLEVGSHLGLHKLLLECLQYKFGIVFIGSRTRDYSQKPLYNLPDNLTYMVETFMFEEENKPPIRAVGLGEAEDFEAIEGLYRTGLERDDL